MAPPQIVVPVKLFVAVLWTDAAQLAGAFERMCDAWGPLDFTGPDHLFDATDYYDVEMGGRPQRRLAAFERLVPPESLRAIKLHSNAIEDELAGEAAVLRATGSPAGGRRVNLDVGYLDHAKVVLGSLKPAGQKIHLGDGVYADLVGRYRDGRYQPFEWTFPDFRDGRYDPDLAAMRRRYLEQLRTGG